MRTMLLAEHFPAEPSQAKQLVQWSRKRCGWTPEAQLSSVDIANNKKSPPF